MIKSYFKVAMRNLWRSKGFSFINITGLAVGMASAILILLWIVNEVSYDKFHKNGDYLYEAWNRGTFNERLQCWNATPKILGITLKQDYPEIENVARSFNRWFVAIAGEKKITSSAMIADSSFLTMFSFPLVEGNEKTALSGSYSIVITRKMANKMFGDGPAMNRIIRIDSNNYTVSGILKDLPDNTQFDFEFILPWAYMKMIGDDDNYWGNNSVHTFVQLKPGASQARVEAKIKNITIDHSKGTEEQEVFLHPISKWHLYSNFENGKISGGRIETVRLFGLIAFFILLIACINFMNLSTARSEKRAKEVGVRKVAGATRKRLIIQFLGESVLIAFLSGLIAILVVQAVLPWFNRLLGGSLTVPYSSLIFWILGFVFVLITGCIAGSYPAFFLSSFNPTGILKGVFKKAHAVVNPRKVLVILQFSFAITLIICTSIVVQQIRYAQERETGYERGQLVYHWLTGDLYKNFALVKNELLSSGVASDVTRTSSLLTSPFSDTWGIQWEGKDPNDKTDFDRYSEDQGFVKTAGLQLVEGRDMDLDQFPSDSFAMLLNESAAKAMKFKDPIGQVVDDGGIKFHVIGVFKDFILASPYEPTRPMIMEGSIMSGFNVIYIKLSKEAKTAQSLGTIEKIFTRYNPAYPFEFHFADEDYARKFEGTLQIASLTGLFAGLTIFISCLGLFGLATYMAQNRIKEIGVRKVLGATVLQVTTLLSKDFLLLVIISIFIASPVAWFIMRSWLSGFGYRTDIKWWVFFFAGILSMLIAIVTISFQAIKAATSNPVRSLRTE